MITVIKADGMSEYTFIERLKLRAQETDRAVSERVEAILSEVRQGGDRAVDRYTLQFDGELPRNREIGSDALRSIAAGCDEDFMSALKNAAENIRRFHCRQCREGFSFVDGKGNLLGQRVKGLEKVGIYVPGGTAAYPSTVLMNTIPAKLAGVREIIMVTPPSKKTQSNRNILAAAAVAGVDRVFQIGGAQAVAALAYGTETVPKVDKIVGPGNIYVAAAKRLVFGTVDIDMVAGPSEILIVADETANPAYLAADMMSQAEHDVLASSILITTDQKIAEKTVKQLEIQCGRLSRSEIIEQSLSKNGGIIICGSLEEAVRLANRIAPEHLEIMTKNPEALLDDIYNAGSVFLGEYSPEPLGDYYAGPNHVLPTSGTARFFSPLSVDSFVKKYSYIKYTKDALVEASADIIKLAQSEGLTAHANSISVRCGGKSGKSGKN